MRRNRTDCSYTYLDNSIHYVVFNKCTYESVDQAAAIFWKIYDYGLISEPVLVLVDITPAGPPPVFYLLKRFLALHEEYGTRPRIQAAVVYNSNDLITLTMMIASKLAGTNAQVRFFPESQRDQATEWLLENDKAYRQ